ncbi:MAG: translesion DNA synthesis-associated protein ImuA [Pseudomonadota bacterium]
MALPLISSSFVSAQHNVWRGDELGVADMQVMGTGHAALDAELPGGGWPVGAMTELLQSRPEAHVWQLLLPALAQAVAQGTGPVALIGAPFEPFGPALAAHGLPVEALMWIRSDAAPARLWACEQALRCADVAAVLAWLPQARAGELRRLQLAAAQHEALLFVFRPEHVALSASPARLRLQLEACKDAESAGQMDVRILKRRGPPLAAPVQLPARSQRMSMLLAASQLRRKARRQEEGSAPPPALASATVVRIDAWKGGARAIANAMDRVAVGA